MMKQATFKNIIHHRIIIEYQRMINGHSINFYTDIFSEKYYVIRNLFLYHQAEEFFKKLNILDEILENIRLAKKTNIKILYDVFFKLKIKAENIIFSGFYWGSTKRGSDFWLNTHRVYVNYCKEIEEKKKFIN